MKAQPIPSLYEEGSLMLTANTAAFQPFADHIGTDGLRERDALVSARDYPHLPALVDVLREMNPNLSEELRLKLDKLASGEAKVVVTGQQTGILGGPLYATYKLLTCLKYAKEAEETLATPVIPIFWLATEDHDFDEINHLIVPTNDYHSRKVAIAPADGVQRSVSRHAFDRDAVRSVVIEALLSETETAYTKSLIETVERWIKESDDYGSFFSRMFGELTGHEVVFFDADHKLARRIEVPFFERLISENEAVRDALKRGIDKASDLPDTQLNDEAAHIFLEVTGRELLYPLSGEGFETKQGHRFTETELLELVGKQPERFSNSVVTRPLMQDFLFPTLAYVGGPGEIAYWARLRPIFHHFDWTMPLLVPRMGALLLRGQDEKRLKQYGLELDTVLVDGVPMPKYDRLETEAALRNVEVLEQALLKELELVESRFLNERHVTEQLSKQIRRSKDAINEGRERKFYRAQQARRVLNYHLLPDGMPQERIHTLLPWLNHYGLDLVRDMRAAYETTEHEQLKFLV